MHPQHEANNLADSNEIIANIDVYRIQNKISTLQIYILVLDITWYHGRRFLGSDCKSKNTATSLKDTVRYRLIEETFALNVPIDFS